MVLVFLVTGSLFGLAAIFIASRASAALGGSGPNAGVSLNFFQRFTVATGNPVVSIFLIVMLAFVAIPVYSVAFADSGEVMLNTDLVPPSGDIAAFVTEQTGAGHASFRVPLDLQQALYFNVSRGKHESVSIKMSYRPERRDFLVEFPGTRQPPLTVGINQHAASWTLDFSKFAEAGAPISAASAISASGNSTAGARALDAVPDPAIVRAQSAANGGR